MAKKRLFELVIISLLFMCLTENLHAQQYSTDDGGLKGVDQLNINKPDIIHYFDTYANNNYKEVQNYFDNFTSNIREYYKDVATKTFKRGNIKILTEEELNKKWIYVGDKRLYFKAEFETADNLYKSNEGVIFYRLSLYKTDELKKGGNSYRVISYLNSKNSYVEGTLFDLRQEVKSKIDKLFDEFLLSYYEVNKVNSND